MAKKLDWPNNVRFVEINFKTGNLTYELERKGYNPNLKTVFLMEGKYYLYNYY